MAQFGNLVQRMTPRQACAVHDRILGKRWSEFNHLHMFTIFVQPGEFSSLSVTSTFQNKAEAVAVLRAVLASLEGAGQAESLASPLLVTP